MKHFKVALVGLSGQTVPTWVADTFNRQGIEFVAHECVTRAELAYYAGDADIVWMFGACPAITAENLTALPRCGAIVRSGSGTDNVPVAEATQRNIVVVNTPAAVNETVSDHTIGLLLAITRQIAVQDRAVRQGQWRLNLPALRWHLHDQTLGLVGFGHIGRLVARKMSGFNMKILAYDPYLSGEQIESQGIYAAELDAVLSQSDFVSLHCPLTPQTHHLIGERELRLMKPEAILINTSRGPVVDESALIKALAEGWIAGAGLDVLDPEPPDFNNPLFQLDNVVITPHIGGFSDESLENAWRLSLEAALDLAQGRWPRSVVNRQVRPRWELN